MSRKQYDLSVLAKIWLFLISAHSIVSGRRCNVVKSYQQKELKESFQPCSVKYSARCGWVSLDDCTRYRQTFCRNAKNLTVTHYYISTECCPGWVLSPDHICIKHTMPVLPENKENVFTVGTYAGLSCAVTVLITVVVLSVLRIRKRLLKQKQKADEGEMELSALEPVLEISEHPVNKLDDQKSEQDVLINGVDKHGVSSISDSELQTKYQPDGQKSEQDVLINDVDKHGVSSISDSELQTKYQPDDQKSEQDVEINDVDNQHGVSSISDSELQTKYQPDDQKSEQDVEINDVDNTHGVSSISDSETSDKISQRNSCDGST